jgi:hypothetical protein
MRRSSLNLICSIDFDKVIPLEITIPKQKKKKTKQKKNKKTKKKKNEISVFIL